MKAKLKIVEVRKDALTELPDSIVPVRLEPVMERPGGTFAYPSSERFTLYYLERQQ